MIEKHIYETFLVTLEILRTSVYVEARMSLSNLSQEYSFCAYMYVQSWSKSPSTTEHCICSSENNYRLVTLVVALDPLPPWVLPDRVLNPHPTNGLTGEPDVGALYG